MQAKSIIEVEQNRVERERAYWDEAYRPEGSHHAQYRWAKRVEAISYVGQRFHELAGALKGKRIISLGGGVDRLGVFLAKNDNEVVTVDVSRAAADATTELARREGMTGRLTALVGLAETVDFEAASFDAVIFKRSLHHMDVPRAVTRAWSLLRADGVMLAEEPVCLARWLIWVHEKFPFAPDSNRTPDERELTWADLELIHSTFRNVAISHFDFLARESLAYFFCKAGIERVLNPLGKLDYVLINRLLPVLRHLSTYVVVRAIK